MQDPIPKAIKLNDGSQLVKLTQEDIGTDEEIEAIFEVRKQFAEEVHEEPEEDEDSDDDAEEEEEEDEDDEGWSSPYEGFEPKDEFYTRMDEFAKLEDDLNERLRKMNIFHEDEEYNLVKDLQTGFKNTLGTTIENRMFDELPEHFFHDIKVPLQKDGSIVPINEANPSRPVQFHNFFDWRENYEYFHRRNKQDNLDAHRPD